MILLFHTPLIYSNMWSYLIVYRIFTYIYTKTCLQQPLDDRLNSKHLFNIHHSVNIRNEETIFINLIKWIIHQRNIITRTTISKRERKHTSLIVHHPSIYWDPLRVGHLEHTIIAEVILPHTTNNDSTKEKQLKKR